MKVISIKQPFASLIVEGVKDIENRTWKLPKKYKGQRVLIHASTSNRIKDLHLLLDYPQIIAVSNAKKEIEIFGSILTKGAIIGSVEIVDCVINHPSIWAEKLEIIKRPSEDDFKIGGKWIEEKILEHLNSEKRKPIYNWVLANPIKFPKPIPVKGKLGFWEFSLKCPEFSHFGACYPDARCIDGYLWDLDSADGEYLTKGGDEPCPYCNSNEYLEYCGWVADMSKQEEE